MEDNESNFGTIRIMDADTLEDDESLGDFTVAELALVNPDTLLSRDEQDNYYLLDIASGGGKEQLLLKLSPHASDKVAIPLRSGKLVVVETIYSNNSNITIHTSFFNVPSQKEIEDKLSVFFPRSLVELIAEYWYSKAFSLFTKDKKPDLTYKLTQQPLEKKERAYVAPGEEFFKEKNQI